MLPDGDADAVVCDTSAKQEWRHERCKWGRSDGADLSQSIGCDTLEPANRDVVEEIKYSAVERQREPPLELDGNTTLTFPQR